MVSPGATDCRFFRKKWGTHAYGFAIHDGSIDLATLQSMFHGTDERIPIGTLELTAKGYMELVKRFLS
jgi:acetylornithine deacetylase/succinyl-diaminopimelate desuccinylase-like protein